MKHYKLHLLCGLSILIATVTACSKKTPQPITKVPFTYNIAGLSDITIHQSVDTVINIRLNVTITSGTPDSVSLFPDTYPKGVSFEQLATTGLPAFSWIYVMKARIDSPGTYPVSIRSSSPSGDTEHHNFNVVVIKDTGCSDKWRGAYTATTTCNSGLPFGGVDNNIPVVANGDTTLLINAIPSLGQGKFIINFNCKTGNSSASVYINSDYSVDPPTCTFTPNTITLNYAVWETPGRFEGGTCQTILTR